MTLPIFHIPVLVHEVVSYMAPKPGELYVDATFGGGGHARALLETEPTCTVISFDWDKHALELNAPPLEDLFGKRFIPVFGSFSNIRQLLKKLNIFSVNGILADFGTSQYQIGQLPGFSFSSDTILDMRMSPGFSKITAYHVINKAPESELATILYKYGEEHKALKIARSIVHYRQERGPIKTTKQLADIILNLIPRYSRTLHPATKTFQALRIFINDELLHIKSLLTQSVDLLENQGRLVCISFHSLEDRIVKQFFKSHITDFKILTPKVVTASNEELEQNKSARSAKLRAAERIKEPKNVDNR